MIQFPLIAGLVAATLHVVSGPDHLAAVTPLAIESNRKVWRVGFLWGVGHLTGMLLIGVLYLLFKDYIPLEQISIYSEQLVGGTLLLIGVWAFYSFFRKNKPHSHPHIHNENEPYIHAHSHKHEANKLIHKHEHKGATKLKLWSSYTIGVLHGLAGIAHFILLLPVLGFENQNESIQYIVGFGLGTILAMITYTLLLGKLTKFSKGHKNQSFLSALKVSGGLFAFIVGIYWLYLSF